MSIPEEKSEIREVLSEYTFLMDDGDFGGVAELFVEDGEWIAPYHTVKGRGAIAAYLAEINPKKGIAIKRKHFVVNSLIQINGGTAKGRASYFVLVDKGDGLRPAVAGTYVDELIKLEKGWRFKSRRLVHDIVGELGINLPSKGRMSQPAGAEPGRVSPVVPERGPGGGSEAARGAGTTRRK
ncbi:MAG: nuclear transport factor 2 family protein [Rhodopila sp.]|nr:nuclear transport factor 2 family protein [Rhodopila sp.]